MFPPTLSMTLDFEVISRKQEKQKDRHSTTS